MLWADAADVDASERCEEMAAERPQEVLASPLQPDGLYFTYEACVDNSTLNEDDSWTDNRDEIYAEVRLVTHNWATIRSAQTNRVYGYF